MVMATHEGHDGTRRSRRDAYRNVFCPLPAGVNEGAAQDSAARAQIIIVQNWLDELKRLVPVN